MNNCQPSELHAGIRRGRPIKHRGFTLLEILVVVIIIGILSGIAYPAYTSYQNKANIERACVDIFNISQTISQFFSDHNQYPATLADVGYAAFLDPWGHPYQYLNIQTAKGKGQMRKDRFLVPINTDYDLYSMGADGQSVPPLTAQVSRDDVIRANNGAYIGLASDY